MNYTKDIKYHLNSELSSKFVDILLFSDFTIFILHSSMLSMVNIFLYDRIVQILS